MPSVPTVSPLVPPGPRVLVAVASRHGATREIAAALARHVAGSAGARSVTLLPVQHRPDPADFDAVVLGSAVYDGRWLPEAADYALRWSEELRDRPVWLFSSGMADGWEASSSPVPEVQRIASAVGAVSSAHFTGRFERRLLSSAEGRAGHRWPFADGDHRNWGAVRAWAGQISTRLGSVGLPVGVG